MAVNGYLGIIAPNNPDWVQKKRGALSLLIPNPEVPERPCTQEQAIMPTPVCNKTCAVWAQVYIHTTRTFIASCFSRAKFSGFQDTKTSAYKRLFIMSVKRVSNNGGREHYLSRECPSLTSQRKGTTFLQYLQYRM